MVLLVNGISGATLPASFRLPLVALGEEISTIAPAISQRGFPGAIRAEYIAPRTICKIVIRFVRRLDERDNIARKVSVNGQRAEFNYVSREIETVRWRVDRSASHVVQKIWRIIVEY